MRKIAWVILLVTLVYILLGYMVGQFATDSKIAFKMDNDNLNMAFVAKLEEENIEYMLDDERVIWFSHKDKEAVHHIAKEMMRDGLPDYLIYWYEDPVFTDIFENKLKESGVSYYLANDAGVKKIRLNSSDKNDWLPIKNEIDEMVIDDARNTVLE